MKNELRLVFWELTARCNLKCRHCRAEAQSDFVKGELTTDEIISVARDIRAAGGPILNPQSTDLLLVPILPHLSMPHPIVLPQASVVVLRLSTTNPATLSIDGHISIELYDGASVTVTTSAKRTHFLRADPPGHFYTSLGQRLRG